MNKQWKNIAAGFVMGICVILIFNAFTGGKEGYRRETQSDENISENINEGSHETENVGTENIETGSTDIKIMEIESTETGSTGIGSSEMVRQL